MKRKVQGPYQEGCSGCEQGLVALREQRSGLLIHGRAAPQDGWRGRLPRPAGATQDAVRLPACQRGDKPYSMMLTVRLLVITSYIKYGYCKLQAVTAVNARDAILARHRYS